MGYVLHVAVINYPLANGTRRSEDLLPGRTLARELARVGAFQAAVRNGVFLASGGDWRPIRLTHRVAVGDQLKVGAPRQKSSGDALGSLIFRVVRAAVSREEK